MTECRSDGVTDQCPPKVDDRPTCSNGHAAKVFMGPVGYIGLIKLA